MGGGGFFTLLVTERGGPTNFCSTWLGPKVNTKLPHNLLYYYGNIYQKLYLDIFKIGLRIAILSSDLLGKYVVMNRVKGVGCLKH